MGPGNEAKASVVCSVKREEKGISAKVPDCCGFVLNSPLPLPLEVSDTSEGRRGEGYQALQGEPEYKAIVLGSCKK